METLERLVYNWQVSGDRNDRKKIPRLEGKLREKAISKLKKIAEFRIDQKGKIEFLLFRGGRHLVSEYKTISSWTAHRSIAMSFARDYEEVSGKDTWVECTWINEDKIHNLPSLFQTPEDEINFWEDEGEVLVGKL